MINDRYVIHGSLPPYMTELVYTNLQFLQACCIHKDPKPLPAIWAPSFHEGEATELTIPKYWIYKDSIRLFSRFSCCQRNSTRKWFESRSNTSCLLYTSDAADDLLCVDL